MTDGIVSIRELSYEERYDYWFIHNYETGMEKNYLEIPEFDNPYYSPTPTKEIKIIEEGRIITMYE